MRETPNREQASFLQQCPAKWKSVMNDLEGPLSRNKTRAEAEIMSGSVPDRRSIGKPVLPD